jgi:transcriptional regulator with GAF, ATPase, and Fis domain
MSRDLETSAQARAGSAAAELVLELDGWLRRVPLETRPVLLGRSSECDVTLADTKLSRRHCRLVPGEGGGWLVEDLESQAGTFVNNVRVREPVRLRPQDRIRFGSIDARVVPKPPLGAVLSGDPERDVRNVEMLLRTIDELYSAHDLDEILRKVIDRTIELAGADRGALFLSSPQGTLEIAVARDSAGHDLPPQQALTRSLPGRALETGRAVVLTDTAAPGQRDALSTSILLDELRSILCVPLPGGERPMGILYADGRRPAAAFGPAELAFFEAFAVHSAMAIERVRMHEAQARLEQSRRHRLEAENASLKAQLGTDAPIGQSLAMRGALDLLRQVAASDTTVCLIGETGTGKEILARYLHRLSPRSKRPFVAIDCGALPEGLIESELFGHERGAFTGADTSREGRFREAEGGTIFLDEIGELPLLLQTRLLRVLQERTVQPVGGKGRIPIDVRVVCATHRDLEQRIGEGQFRKDLYYRIAVVTVPIPALRERDDDISLLAHHFLTRYAATYGRVLTDFTREAMEALLEHDWPGNVRELENRVQRAALLARRPYVTKRDLGLGTGADEPDEAESPFPTLQQARGEATEEFERAYLERLLRHVGGNVSRAATVADVSRQLIQRLLRRHQIDRLRFTALSGGDGSPED